MTRQCVSAFEVLLDFHQRANTFLETPPAALLATAAPTADMPPIAERPAHRSAPTSSCKRSAKAAWASSTWPTSENRFAAEWR